MTKSKSKSPQKNILRYLLDEYVLFRREFVIETSASVQDCATRLDELSYENKALPCRPAKKAEPGLSAVTTASARWNPVTV